MSENYARALGARLLPARPFCRKLPAKDRFANSENIRGDRAKKPAQHVPSSPSLPLATAAPPSPPTHSAATTALLPRIDGHSELRRRLLHLLAADPVLGGLAVAVIVAAAPAGRRRVQPPPATFR